MAKPWRDASNIRKLYWGKEMSSREIADEWDCGKRTVLKWMERHDIQRRNQGVAQGPWENSDLLERLYCDKDMSIQEIADHLGAGSTTIGTWLDKHGIERDQPMREIEGPWQDEDTLLELYIEKERSINDIAAEFGCAYSTVRRWLKIHEIPRRKRGGTVENRVHLRTDEKGYERAHGRDGFVYLHRLIMAVDHSLSDLKGKHVHHKNQLKWDNRPENLELLTPKEHSATHAND